MKYRILSKVPLTGNNVEAEKRTLVKAIIYEVEATSSEEALERFGKWMAYQGAVIVTPVEAEEAHDSHE